MDPVYVTGHRNPDTDSIVSAIAYANLRHALGDHEYVAARLGNISDETNSVLQMFDAEAPKLITNIRTQVRDLDIDTPPALDHTVTISRAWDMLSKGEMTVLPVIDDDDKLFGMLTSGDIAAYTMKNVANSYVYDIPTYNLLSVLEGQIVNQVEELPETISGDVVLAVPQGRDSLVFNTPDTIAVCGQQPDMIKHAIDIGCQVVIVCQADVSEEFREDHSGTCIIATPLCAYKAARRIHLALPIERICAHQEIMHFHLDDYVDEVKDVLLKSRFRAYPVLDENDKLVGTMGRFHLIRPNRKKVVLVDHNELSQSVPGLSQAEILGILDHHRIADIQTTSPIFFRNEPLGSTATIIAMMYQEKGLMPSKKIAGLLAAAIISDTVMFKSPTCTDMDKTIAERMARIANVSLDDIGNNIFDSGNEDKPVEEVIFSDFKEFLIADHKLGIGQVTCFNSERYTKRFEDVLKAMEERRAEKGYDYILIMLTDVLKEGTLLLYIGDDETISHAYNVDAHDMSRKKQIVPRLSELWG